MAGASTLTFVTTFAPRWGSVTIDCLDPERMAKFWAAMLGTSVRGRWEQYVNLHPVAGGPVLAFQRVEAKSPGKNALHLDLRVAHERERDEVARRAKALGGRVVDLLSQDDTEWLVLEDPEANRFCVVAVAPMSD